MLTDDTSGEIYSRQQLCASPAASQLSPITVFALPCVPIMIPAPLIDAWQELSAHHFWSISTFQQWTARYLSTPTDFPSINAALCCVCANCQLAARFFVRLQRGGLASRRARFLLRSVWRPSSDRGKRETGGNKSEGGERQRMVKEIETETRA